jgi:hypothetical protein
MGTSGVDPEIQLSGLRAPSASMSKSISFSFAGYGHQRRLSRNPCFNLCPGFWHQRRRVRNKFFFLRAMRTSGVYSEVHSSTFSRLVARKASISKSTVPNCVVYGASGIDFEIHESEFCGLWEPPDSVLKSMLQNCPGGQLAASASI